MELGIRDRFSSRRLKSYKNREVIKVCLCYRAGNAGPAEASVTLGGKIPRTPYRRCCR